MTHLRGSRMAYRQLRFDRDVRPGLRRPSAERRALPRLSARRLFEAIKPSLPWLVVVACYLIAGLLEGPV